MTTTTTNKYDINPNRIAGQRDIVSHVAELYDRIASQDTGLRAGNTAIEDGNFVVRNGDIIVSESDDSIVLRIKHGNSPEILFYPLGDTDTHLASLIGYDFSQGVGDPDQAVQLYIARESDLEPDGGKLLLTRGLAILSYQPDVGDESYLWIDSLGFLLQGRFADQSQVSGADAIYTGAFTATSGFSTWTHTYFTPFATNIVPIFTVGVNGTTIQWGIEQYSQSNFIIRFSTTAGNKFVTFWNVRL